MLARYCDSIVKVLRAGRRGEGVVNFLAKFFDRGPSHLMTQFARR